MPQLDVTRARWIKSSYSETQNACVEVDYGGELVGVRDSKRAEVSPVLAFTAPAWASFVTALTD